MHTVFALLCFVVVIHWLIFPYPSGLLHWHCGNLTIAPVPAKEPWWIWINTSCEFIMNDYITTTKQSTTKPCAYFLGYTVPPLGLITHYAAVYQLHRLNLLIYKTIHRVTHDTEMVLWANALRPIWCCRQYANDIFKCISFLMQTFANTNSLKNVP